MRLQSTSVELKLNCVQKIQKPTAKHEKEPEGSKTFPE